MTLRLNGSTSGYSEIDAPAIAGDQVFTLPTTGGTLDRINRAGNILQVVNAVCSVAASSTTTVYADTGLTASITPSSASNKILVYVTQNGITKTAGNINSGVGIKLLRGATELALLGNAIGFTGTSTDLNSATASIVYLDSPASTSSVTYKTTFANYVSAATVYVQLSSQVSTITLIEVAA